ncbi:MAG: ATP-binding protein [Bacteroidota bacterium]
MQFRTKARAVDLLGKGQIADLPTAITELWKNGYDAYADNLTAEIFESGYLGISQPMFLLTDDGKGMSKRDILEKWLVLGTDSKSRAIIDEKGEETLWKNPRTKAGEKGIGRLSVAYLGHPMLMITKKMGHPIQLLFFDWRLLENFNLFLDDINIPVSDLKSINDFEFVFNDLKNSFLQNFEKEQDLDNNNIWEDKQLELKSDILNSVKKASLTTELRNLLLSDLTNIEENYGSKFLIFEPISQILDLGEASKNEEDLESRNFSISSLSGFVNPFIDIAEAPKTNFFIHQIVGKEKELFNSEANFFKKEDYDLADILIEGEFDGNGSFNGKLKIYDNDVIKYQFNSNRRKLKSRNYGNLSIKLGYSQGRLSDSKLTETAWKKINDKVTSNGGLYIYRDNFRVLPYGRPNADFLKFEERRNRRIGSFFFSYRRMFGFIGLTRNGNSELRDKSSREGLINNDQYRAFESDLIAFFSQVAKDYFSDKAEKTLFLDAKRKLNEQHEAIESDKKRESDEKKIFSKELSKYPGLFKQYEQEYFSLVNSLESKVSLVNVTYQDIEKILEEIQRKEIEFDNLLPPIPKRYKPTELQLDRLNQYEEQITSFKTRMQSKNGVLMDQVTVLLELQDLERNFTKSAEVYKGELEQSIFTHQENLQNNFGMLMSEYKARSQKIIGEFEADKTHAINAIREKSDLEKQSNLLKSKYVSLKNTIETTLVPLVNHIDKMSFDIDEELLQGAYKAQYDQIRQQWNTVQETAQLGIAVEIIDHEFNVLYSRINRLLSDLEEEKSIKTLPDFKLLEKTFRSLEDKYDLLSPLYRINGAIEKEIKCSEIINYVNDFFGRKLKEENIVITASDAFLKHIIAIKEPILYTVTINLINNAIYWMRNSEKKEIRFDYFKEHREILILNSGTKIEEHRLGKIFDLFYSNRPTGRGIGLYLAKQSLNENYLDIEATNNLQYNYLGGACFVIKPLAQ